MIFNLFRILFDPPGPFYELLDPATIAVVLCDTASSFSLTSTLVAFSPSVVNVKSYFGICASNHFLGI